MSYRRFASCSPRLPRALAFLLVSAAFLLVSQSPLPVFAQDVSDEEGCGCHSAESDAWEMSPHAQAALESGEGTSPTCEGCHGPYVRGHPDDGLMRLTLGSTVCHDCHNETYDQWEHSRHAQAEVTCTGCHLSHSQTLRLSDERLCVSCHRESLNDGFHVSHTYADVQCTSCHVTPAGQSGMQLATSVDAGGVQAPSHDFAAVAPTNCVDCHRKTIADGSPSTSGEAAISELMTVANRVPELSARLEFTEQQNHQLAAITFVSLGLGIGIGGVMGMALVLAVGYVMQRRQR